MADLLRLAPGPQGAWLAGGVVASPTCVALSLGEQVDAGDGSETAFSLIRSGPPTGPWPVTVGSPTRDAVKTLDVSGASMAWVSEPGERAYVADCTRRTPARAFGPPGGNSVRIAGGWVAVHYLADNSLPRAEAIAVFDRATGALTYEVRPTRVTFDAWDLSGSGALAWISGGARVGTLHWTQPGTPVSRVLDTRALIDEPLRVLGDQVMYVRRPRLGRADRLVVRHSDRRLRFTSPPIERIGDLAGGVDSADFDYRRVVYATSGRIWSAAIENP